MIHTQNSTYNADRHIERYYPTIRDNHNHDVNQHDSLAEKSDFHSYRNEKKFESTYSLTYILME